MDANRPSTAGCVEDGQSCPSNRGSSRMAAVGCLHWGTDRIVRPPLNLFSLPCIWSNFPESGTSMADDKMLSSTAAATTLPSVAAAPRPTREEDNRMARACAAGDAAAFEELYRRGGGPGKSGPLPRPPHVRRPDDTR